MDEVLELAAKLSQAIARSSRFTELRKAEGAVMADTASVEGVRKRDELIAKLAEKEQAGQPIEPEEKRNLMALDEAVRSNTLLADLSKAQADFQEMLNKVNGLITSALEPAEEPKPEEPKPEEPKPED